MKRITLFSLTTMLLVLMFSCKTTKLIQEPADALAPVLVYKTKADYSQLVPVSLNESGDKVVSYPAPADLYTNGMLALPVQLDNGFLFDQRGINPRTAFTSYTYDEYSKLETAPSVHELLDKIVDPDPFEQLYDCGNRSQYKNMEKDLNKLIRKKFRGTKSLVK